MLAMFVCSQTVIANDDVSVEFGPDVDGRDQGLHAALTGRP